jgi:transcriptional regulator with XRE-family HTH domain
MARLRARGLSLAEIGRRLGVSKQCVHGTLALMRRPPAERSVLCAGCGTPIVSAGALSSDAGLALCLPCLTKRADTPFGVWLKSLRLLAGLTKSELARAAGAAPRQIDEYERGAARPHPSTRARVTSAVSAAVLRQFPGWAASSGRQAQ